MNRLAPLIVRRTGRFAAAVPLPRSRALTQAQASDLLDNLKLFATAWLGGLIFFGTFLA